MNVADLVTIIVVVAAVSLLAFLVRRWHWQLQSEIASFRRDLARLSKGAVKKINANTDRQIDGATRQMLNAASLSALDFKFPVMLGGFSIDAHHARLLVELLLEHKPRRIVELGSGSSTVIIAKALQSIGQPAEVHIAVDHDAHYLELTRQLCRFNGVEHLVQFEHCPLIDRPSTPLPWYSRLPELLGETRIDLLVVDGPPAFPEGRERIREPALDVLAAHFSASTVVVLDDANRAGERAIVDAWLDRHRGFQCRTEDDGKGVAILFPVSE